MHNCNVMDDDGTRIEYWSFNARHWSGGFRFVSVDGPKCNNLRRYNHHTALRSLISNHLNGTYSTPLKKMQPGTQYLQSSLR